MKYIKTLTTLVLFFLVSCSVSKYQKMGNVISDNFYYKTKFTTLKTLIILPMEMDGVQKNFLFDTGAELSIIQRDSVFGKSFAINAPGKTSNSGSETVKSLIIGNINFANTFATNMNMIGANEQLSNFGGVIGQSIINKANWLINYPKKTIEIFNKDLANNTFKTLRLIKENDIPNTFISIDGKVEKAIIDLGCSSQFILPKETELAKYLLSKYKFEDVNRKRSSIGASEIVFEKKANIPLIKLSEIEFKNVKVTIGDSKKNLIGISFFQDYQIYIDNTNNSYKIKKVN